MDLVEQGGVRVGGRRRFSTREVMQVESLRRKWQEEEKVWTKHAGTGGGGGACDEGMRRR
jgi:hypothetical protein